ncbi:hypothetical protein AMS66_12790 [Paenibacillus xylanivorans]|uniref:Uncharacterized protein n=1 Tax=Paenibacillus xylanivorans TaxID=1705561 RepID=A0A0M9BPC4_9BACL|nr:hypothetical protein AMS66_12790 [Paenibacillus xylanivorans]
MHERVDRLDMWIAIRGMINQKKIFLWIQETVDREMREANRVGFFCCRVRRITCVQWAVAGDGSVVKVVQ